MRYQKIITTDGIIEDMFEGDDITAPENARRIFESEGYEVLEVQS